MGRNDSSCRDSHKTTGYPLTLRECSFTVVRGPLSGSQAPHRLALLLICFTLQGGRTTYPASPQGNSQLSRNEVTINKTALLHNDHNSHKVQMRKRCSNTNTRFATRKKHKQPLALGSGEYKQVFFQVSTNSKQFLQSYTSAANRSTALSTTVLQLDTIPRPKALLRTADSINLSQN